MITKNDNLIVFDWNGTVLADASACWHATNVVLEKLGAAKVTRSQYQNFYTMPIQSLYIALGVDEATLNARAEEIHPLYHSTYEAAKIRLRRDARTMLNHLKQMPCKPVILSNYIQERIEDQAKRLGVRDDFHDVIAFHTGDATFRKRGKGQRLKNYLIEHSASASLIVGDSEEEIEIGKEKGIVTVAITDGMCSTSRLRAKKPDFLISSLGEIPEIVRGVLARKEAA